MQPWTEARSQVQAQQQPGRRQRKYLASQLPIKEKGCGDTHRQSRSLHGLRFLLQIRMRNCNRNGRCTGPFGGRMPKANGIILRRIELGGSCEKPVGRLGTLKTVPLRWSESSERAKF